MGSTMFKSVLILGAAVALLSFDEPASGWKKMGSARRLYDMGVDNTVKHEGRSAYTIKNNTVIPQYKFGTLLQDTAPDKFSGKRVRLSGYIKTDRLVEWASLWMRVDGKELRKSLAFDNMEKRPIKATTDWQKYEVVLDVAQDATNIGYGALMVGEGQIWFDDLKLEIVDETVPVTDMYKKKEQEVHNPAAKKIWKEEVPVK